MTESILHSLENTINMKENGIVYFCESKKSSKSLQVIFQIKRRNGSIYDE